VLAGSPSGRSSRNQVLAILGEQLGPFHELPRVQQCRLAIQEILYLGARGCVAVIGIPAAAHRGC